MVLKKTKMDTIRKNSGSKSLDRRGPSTVSLSLFLVEQFGGDVKACHECSIMMSLD